MNQYRKKGIVVTAEQYDRGRRAPDGVCFQDHDGMTDAHIHTLEGPLRVRHLDWIVTGIEGERYPVKPEIFFKTYERA